MKEASRDAVKYRDGKRCHANIKVYTFPGEKRLAVTQAHGPPQVDDFGETESSVERSAVQWTPILVPCVTRTCGTQRQDTVTSLRA